MEIDGRTFRIQITAMRDSGLSVVLEDVLKAFGQVETLDGAAEQDVLDRIAASAYRRDVTPSAEERRVDGAVADVVAAKE